MKVGQIFGLGVLGALAALSLGMGNCGGGGNDGGTDAGTDAGITDAGAVVAINFSINATGRPGFYADEDLEWKGAFSYDKTTRMLTYASNWPGPYAGLWDDGPITSGGHEPPGATAGDDIFGISAKIAVPAADLTLEYGAQTKEGGWIWVGGNGSVLIPANSITPITADGMTLSPEGDVDLRLFLNTTNLAAPHTFTAGDTITVKGQMSNWEEDPAFDDGTHGDVTSGDGIYTYTLSDNAKRRLKLTNGTNVEFIWVLHHLLPDAGFDNVEYKVGSVAATSGTSADINDNAAGWVAATISMAANDNTQVVIP